MSKVNNGNYRRRGEFHILIGNKICQIQMLNLNLANRINGERNKTIEAGQYLYLLATMR